MPGSDKNIYDRKGCEVYRRTLKTPADTRKSEDTASDKNKKDSRNK